MTLADALLTAAVVMAVLNGALVGLMVLLPRRSKRPSYFGEIGADPDRTPTSPTIDRLRNTGVL